MPTEDDVPELTVRAGLASGTGSAPLGPQGTPMLRADATDDHLDDHRDDEPDGQGEFDDPEADAEEEFAERLHTDKPAIPVLVCAVCGLRAGTCGHQPGLTREEYPT